MDERRKEQRYPVEHDAFVWDFPDGGFHSAVVEDVSRSGMRLKSDYNFKQGDRIAVDLNGMIVCGTVQYCRPLGKRFAVGIRINHVDDGVIEGVLGQCIRTESAERQLETAPAFV